jgi:predicted HicB family RNase H-like nuclease
MANKASRGEVMSDYFMVRCSTNDKAQLKLLAQEEGKSISAFIRSILIERRVLPTTWTTQDEVLMN